jgi:hypothetical protein
MAISTESQNLSDFYKQKIALDTEQLSQLKIITDDGYDFRTGIGESQGVKIWSSSELLSLFDSIIEPIDSQIVSVNSQINSLRNQILINGLEANSVGCGGTWGVGVTTITVYEDKVKYVGYDFSGANPFTEIDGNINSSNVGMGTYNYVTQVAIGTYYGPIDTCNISSPLIFVCDSGDCENYADTITNLNSQISSLSSTRTTLNTNVNVLKEERIRYELQDYAYRKSKQNLQAEIQNSQTILNFIQSY